MASYLAGLAAKPGSKPQAPRKGLFGMGFGPDFLTSATSHVPAALGLRSAVNQFGQGLYGLGRLGSTALTPNDPHSRQVQNEFVTGIGKSIAGLAVTPANLVGRHPFQHEGIYGLGDQFKQQGLLPTVINNLGLVAGGAGALESGIGSFGGAASRIASASEAASAAERAGIAASNIDRAVAAGQSGERLGGTGAITRRLAPGKLAEEGVSGPLLRKVATTAKRANGLEADAGDVASMQRVLHGLETAKHPYQFLGDKLSQPGRALFRGVEDEQASGLADQAGQLNLGERRPGAGNPLERTSENPLADEPVPGPGLGQQSLLGEEPVSDVAQEALPENPAEPPETIAPKVGPKQTASIARHDAPIPEWAQNLADKFPERIQKPLLRAETAIRNREAMTVRRETERFAESQRRRLLNEGGVPLAKDAAQMLVDYRGKDGQPLQYKGAPVTAEIANRMVGDHIMAAHEGRRMLEYMVSQGMEATPELQQAVSEAAGRKFLIPDHAMSQVLESTLNSATDEFAALSGEREAMLRGGALGDRGLEGIGSDDLNLTPSEIKKFRDIEAGFKKVAGLQREDQKVRLAAAKAQMAKNLDLDRLNGLAESSDAAAKKALAKLRNEAMPVTLTGENRAGTIATLEQKVIGDLADSGGSYGGGTFDPHTGTWEGLESGARAAVGVAGDTMPTAEFLADPAVAITKFLDRFDDRLVSKDGKVGIFVDGETTYLDVSQTTIDGKPMSREQAIVLGTARGEKSIWDFMAGGREAVLPQSPEMQIVAGQHAAELARPGSQLNRYLRRFGSARLKVEEWQRQDAIAAAYDGKTAEVRLDPNNWGDLLQAQMVQNSTLVALGHEKNLDQVYGKMDIEANATMRKPPHEVLMQQFLAKDFMSTPLDKDLWDKAMRDLGPEADSALNWYYENHNIIRERWGDETITLFDEATQAPREVPIRDLMFSLLAVTSKNTSPGPNATYALQGLTALANLGDMNGMAAEMSDALRGYRDTLARDKAAGRLDSNAEINSDALFRALGAKVQHMTDVRADVMDILHGHLVGDWDEAFIESKSKSAAESVRKIRASKGYEDMLPEQIMEAGGSNQYAKIRSFYENLSDPEGSRGVTLDRVMGQMLGLGSTAWGNKGAYTRAADAFRQYADQMSVAYYGETGRIKPHQAQALFWVWTKNKLQQSEMGRAWATANDAVAAVHDLDAESFRNGTDPISMHYHQLAQKQGLGDFPTQEASGLGEPNKPVTQVHQIAGTDVKEATKKLAAWNSGPGQKVADAIEQGDLLKAHDTIVSWTKQEQARINKPAETFDAPWTGGKGAGKLAEQVISDLDDAGLLRDRSQPGVDVPGAPDGGWDNSLLQQSMDETAMGMMYGNTKTGRLTMRFLRTADPTTLVHENAHLLRQMLPTEDVESILEAYSDRGKTGLARRRSARDNASYAAEITGTRGSTAMEERFAEDMLRHMMTGQAPTGLERAFTGIREALTQWWAATGDRFTKSVDNGVADVLNKYLDPSEAAGILGDQSRGPEPTALDFGGLSPKQLRDKLQPRPGESETQTLNRGKRIGSAALEADAAQKQAAVSKLAADRVNTAIEKMVESIAEKDIPGASQAAAQQLKSERQFGSLLNKVETSDSLRSKPAAWQPMWETLTNLRELSKEYPALADGLSQIPETFTGFVDYATQRGLDPTHVAHLSDTRVRALVYGRLGVGGKLVEAGTRTARGGTLDFDRSIEALAAAQTDVIREANNNAFVQYIQNGHAIPVAPGAEIPKGFVAWDPARAFLNTTREPGTSEVRAALGPNAPKYMLPESTAHLLDRWANPVRSDYGLLRGVQKITNPWRALVLTWTPRWYLNNVIGNMILATKEGVSLADWASAWTAYKNDFKGGVGGAMGGDISRDLATGEPSLMNAPGYRAAREQGASRTRAIGAGYNKAASKAARANTVVDDLARAAVYLSSERKGFSPEHALQRSYEAMVDYGNLSDVEQAYVRAAVPFYAWQKGILKQVIKFPVDHPVRAALMMQLGQLNEHLTQDLPDAYKGLVHLPGGRAFNLRPFNPFADATAMVTPQGIAGSLNPFEESLLRNALDAPATGYPEAYRVDELGRAMPTTNPLQESIGAFLQTPQAGAVGLAPSGRNVGGFFGLKTYSPGAEAKIKTRYQKSQQKQKAAENTQAGISNAKPKARGRGSFLSTLGS